MLTSLKHVVGDVSGLAHILFIVEAQRRIHTLQNEKGPLHMHKIFRRINKIKYYCKFVMWI
jgi:hypothetical protein